MPEPFLCTKQAARRLHLSPATLERMRVRGDGPPFLRVSQTRIVYDCEMLDAWARSRRCTSTSERAA
ncbi:hypothetical protein GGQ85_001683 [Nitrobacter vulgaris]|jgi:hypothetical protein|uniref:helix-turn-helix domain-containing protein n=1 Tax=Nitrobacter vulgaris TaxID=29421 RepID=UPI0028574BBB|nr:helix-turn-helix domain-containing protein [Nitrobacter vulgaris]MDR6303984.1 hypothetical protein [Nitrobacter vulgaris]